MGVASEGTHVPERTDGMPLFRWQDLGAYYYWYTKVLPNSMYIYTYIHICIYILVMVYTIRLGSKLFLPLSYRAADKSCRCCGASYASLWLVTHRLLVYQNETRLIGRPSLPVIITETGWSRDFCTEEQRAGWQVSAWQAWFDDPQLLAACPFDLEGPRIQGFPWIDPSGQRLPVFTETKALRCQLLDETCRNCLTALPDAREPNVTGEVSLEACSSVDNDGAAQLWMAEPIRGSGSSQAAEHDSLSTNVTLSVNVSAPSGSGSTYWRQYLSCRADGQPGHACQPGDDVDIWFGAGATATNQHWTIRPCQTGPTGSQAVEVDGASLIVSAMSSACVSSSGLMVECNCTDTAQLWHPTTATATGHSTTDATAVTRYRLINQQ